MEITQRARAVRLALLLEVFTIGYMLFEGAAALALGLINRSVSLETFGLDSLIELAAASVLLWRLNAERRGAAERGIEQVEQRAARLVGISLLVLAGLIVIGSGYTLLAREQPEATLWGVLLAVTSLIVMPFLAKLKLNAADRIGSRALHADAYESIACAYLAFTLLVGLGANYWLGFWWADPLAALVMVYFILREAREALSGESAE